MLMSSWQLPRVVSNIRPVVHSVEGVGDVIDTDPSGYHHDK